VEDLRFVDEIKDLLKMMKSSAIDSLPKIKLVWKILTTNTQVDIDINDVDTLYQIPILEKILKVNETFKHYLVNLNQEVNAHRIFIPQLPQYPTIKLGLEDMAAQTEHLLELVTNTFAGPKPIRLHNKGKP
jgi:hypothetical protein